MAHPRHQLDEAFQTPVRFSLMAALGSRAELDFKTLRELLEADDSVLSKSIAHLEKAGYVRVTKGYAANRPKTWVQATAKGHRAFQSHLDALRAITDSMPSENAPAHGTVPHSTVPHSTGPHSASPESEPLQGLHAES